MATEKDKSTANSAPEKMKHLMIQIPASLHKKLKINAAKEEVTMAKIVCDILEEKFKKL